MAFQLRGRSSGIQLPGSRRARLTINPLSNPMGVRGQRREGGFQVANKGPKTGFAKIKKAEVSKIKRRGGKTAGGKKIRDPEAYVAGAPVSRSWGNGNLSAERPWAAEEVRWPRKDLVQSR